MIDFNIIRWAVKQPKDSLLGILIFASSYLVFLKVHTSPLTVGEHMLWFLMFLAGSLFLGFFTSFLCRESVKKIKSTLNERLLNNPDAARIFMKIEAEGNKIENSPHYQYGLAGCINIEAIAQELDINESRVRNFIQEFIRFDWLIHDHLGDIYGINKHGRRVMRRKKMMR